MPETRRKLLVTLMGAAGLVAAEPILWGQITRNPCAFPDFDNDGWMDIYLEGL